MELLEREETTVIPSLPQASELAQVAEGVFKAAHAIVINSPMMYEVAASELQSLQTKLEELNNKRFAVTRPMDAAKKNVMELFRAPTERCEVAITHLKNAMLTFSKAEREKAAAAQKEADELARQERLKLEQKAREEQAEADRKAREIADAEQKARAIVQQAANAAAAGDRVAEERANEELLLINQTKATAEAEQQHAMARVALSQTVAAVMSAPVVASITPKIAGVSTSAPWTAEVTDLFALVRFVAANPAYISFLQANLVPIKQQAKALQINCRIDGVRVFQEERLTSRRK
ncbi:hypothetical protein [Undibacterium umbellatum]|uniref:Uncharacterized protein n=1 Tax=Undibacterium umbellatum TaxID=2762300 RepID=A0ABR6Z4J8_9BURK|nr:hypothetical protein [Undibacterium umbellatum]MBC3906241.1 hypothetical protein [Undibacterium umbellatum]